MDIHRCRVGQVNLNLAFKFNIWPIVEEHFAEGLKVVKDVLRGSDAITFRVVALGYNQ